LLHVSYGLNSSTSLSRVLERLLDSLLTTIWADKGYVLLLSGKSRRLEVKVAKSRGGILENVGFEDFSFRLLERAVEEKESLFWPATDMEPPREVGSPTLESLLRNEDRDRTLLCLPLKLRNTTIGGAYLERGTQTQRFSRRERVLSEAICHQAAIAIDNARLYEKLRSKQKAVEAACTEAQDKNLRLGILNEKLDQKVAELSALNAVSRGMNMISTLDEVLKLIMEKSMELVGVEKGSIMLVNDETGFLEVKTLLGGSSLEPVTGATRLKIGDGIAGLALKQGVPVIITDGFKNKKFKRLMESDRSIRNLLCVPLILNSRKIGVINLTNKLNGPGFTENDKIVVTTMANQAAITIENARLYNMAVFDGLTNLHVPRYFHVCLQNELSRSRRYGTQLSLILADLDYFKKINDIHGHQVGDLVLQQFAQIIKQTKRNIDIAARYGGEEFAVILPETDLEGAIIFAERLRDATESNPVKIRDQSIVATVSIGVANFPTSAIRSRGQLIALADQALYEAKRNGRNGVRFAAEGTPIPETEPDQEIREAFI